MEILLNTLFPPKCIGCHNIGSAFCTDCLKTCTLLEHPDYLVKSLKTFSCFEYEGLIRLCIKKAKYSSREFAAFKILASLGVKYARNLNLDYTDFMVVPIPLSAQKLKKRQLNITQLVAGSLAREFSLEMQNSILHRIKDTKVQHSLTRKERYKNLAESFTAVEATRSLKILIVDDICTSGATFYEASKALYKAGAKEVRAFSLTRTLL